MSSIEFLDATVAEVFQDESISTESITAYISSNGILFGICEESDDLTILEKSYEQQSE
jgi:hypothetical protein